MLTPFGKLLRKIRIDQDKTLADVAEMANVTAAFVSALETGKKPVPSGFVEQVRQGLCLTQLQVSALTSAAALQAKEVTIALNHRSDKAKELAVAFARRFDSLSETDIAGWLKKIDAGSGD